MSLSLVAIRSARTLRGPNSREVLTPVFFCGLLRIQVSMLPLLTQPRQGAWPSFTHLTLEALEVSVSFCVTWYYMLRITLPAATFMVSSRASVGGIVREP
jgi:hypothetical protein